MAQAGTDLDLCWSHFGHHWRVVDNVSLGAQKMRVQAEPTDILVTVDAVECRVWNAVTEDNRQCVLFVHRILFPDSSTSFSELENDLIPKDPPQDLERAK